MTPLVLMLGLAVLAPHATPGTNDDLDHIMHYLRISQDLATAGQIRYDDIPAIREAGFDVVVNLAPAHKERNGEEGFRVTSSGMSYIHIPVDWRNPSPRDLQLFFDVMEANRDRKVVVHCFANMRVSAFVYLYRTLKLGVAKGEARRDLEKIWRPESEAQWARFIERAETEASK